MYSKITGEGVKYSATEYNNLPNKVIEIHKVVATQFNENRKKELDKSK